MSARRTDIRNAFRAAITGLATTGANVFLAAEASQIDAAQLPALVLWSGEASPNGALISRQAPVQFRWRLVVGIRVKASAAAEATVDAIVDELRAALFSSPTTMTLGGQVLSLTLAGIGEVEIDDAQDEPVLAAPVFFDCGYA